MKYLIKMSEQADKQLRIWKKSSPQLFKKFQQVYHELAEHPREGIGHPKPLVGGDGAVYSRRITGQHRIIYRIYEAEVKVHVVELGGHYNDK